MLIQKKFVPLRRENLNIYIMTEVVLSLPNDELDLLTTLAAKFGWNVKTKEDLINRFITASEQNVEMSDEEIMVEVKAVRCSK